MRRFSDAAYCDCHLEPRVIQQVAPGAMYYTQLTGYYSQLSLNSSRVLPQELPRFVPRFSHPVAKMSHSVPQHLSTITLKSSSPFEELLSDFPLETASHFTGLGYAYRNTA